LPPHQTRARYQAATSEQSCFFLKIPLFIIIFLPNKWHERINHKEKRWLE
jgi:hypothetical protein